MRSFQLAPPVRGDRGPSAWTRARSLIWGLTLLAVAMWSVLILSN
jgi:hypothetical protein